MGKVKKIDIANALGISRNTVAKALSDKGAVAYRTRVDVIKKAVEMGYEKLEPEIISKYNVPLDDNQKEKTILIINRKDISAFWNRIIVGINDALAKEGYSVKLVFVNEEDEDHWEISQAEHICGLLVLSVYSDTFIEAYLNLNKPIVFFDMSIKNSVESAMGDVVLSEGLYSVMKIVEHLVAQGVKKIGFIGDTTYYRTIRERYDGFVFGLKSAGIEPDKSIIVKEHNAERYYDKPCVEAALASFGYIPEAIVCANDSIALYLIQCLKDRELRVPQDVIVTGFDNLESLIEQLTPFLTTINIHHYELGKRLVNQIFWRIKNPDAQKEIVMIMGEMMIRDSSIRS